MHFSLQPMPNAHCEAACCVFGGDIGAGYRCFQ